MHQQEVGVWPQKLQCVPVNPGHPCTSSSLGAALTNHLQGLGEVAQLVRSLMAKSEFNIPGPVFLLRNCPSSILDSVHEVLVE